MNRDGAGRRLVTMHPFTNEMGAMAWSPDGTRLLYRLSTAGGDSLLVIGTDGSNRAVLARADSDTLRAASWSPDGQSIAYTRSCVTTNFGGDEYCDVAVMNADGTEARTLVNRLRGQPGGPASNPPFWLSDSKRLVVPLWGYAVGVKLVDSQTRAAKVLAKRSWSPIRPGSDGETFLFIDAVGNRPILGLVGHGRAGHPRAGEIGDDWRVAC